MGQRASKTRKESFTDVVPAAQKAKLSSTAAPQSPAASARPVEATIPSIDAPPHALLRSPTTARAAPPSCSEPDARFAVPESVRKSHTLTQFEHTCSEILPGLLFVSNLQVAQDREALRAVGITHVVNCCKEVACSPADAHGISYLQLAVRDGVQEDLLPFFPLVVEWIEECRRSGGRVLIHCHQGVSRSCAFAIAYVMYRDRGGFQSANALVKAQRAICAPNAAFLCQLLEWERDLAAAEKEIGAEYGLYRLAPHAAYDAETLVLKLCYAENSRRKVAFDDKTRLWQRGIFVYVDAASRGIVVWKGSQCEIPNGVDVARQHVERMLRILAGEATEMTITVVESDGAQEGEDQFEYASELAWMEKASAVVTADTTETHQAYTEEIASVLNDKPTLCLLEGNGQWERLTNYDSDDLLPSSVLLLTASQRSYLWIGEGHIEASVDILRAQALQYINECGKVPELQIEQQGSESEAFWDAFEAGY